MTFNSKILTQLFFSKMTEISDMAISRDASTINLKKIGAFEL